MPGFGTSGRSGVARGGGWALGAAGVVAVVLFMPLPAAAGAGAWTAIGPDAGIVTGLATDPEEPRTLFAVTSDSGLLKTSDGGDSWVPAEPPTIPRVLGPRSNPTRRPSRAILATPGAGCRLRSRPTLRRRSRRGVAVRKQHHVSALKRSAIPREPLAGAPWVGGGGQTEPGQAVSVLLTFYHVDDAAGASCRERLG
jgi:hypothetical protein